MNGQHQLNFCKASLVSLQAELARKREEITGNKKDVSINKTRLEIKPHIQIQLNSKPKVNVTADVDRSDKNDTDNIEQHQTNNALLAKSKLYEKLRNKELVTEESNQFLVDFSSQNNNEIKNEENDNDFEDSDPESEWVTFVDSLGRTRTCLRTDVSYYKGLDAKLRPSKIATNVSLKEDEPIKIVSEELLLWDKRREELRKVWEEEEKRLNDKRDIHYQDVLFNEARSHGVGYFNFSQDEGERQKQQEALKKLREETEKNQILTIDLKERRRQQMQKRIDAAKKRKRQKMGLPPEAEEDEPSSPESKQINKPDDTQSEETKELEKKVEEFLRNAKRSTHIRPWDVGKDGVKLPVLTQSEWNERQRAKRLQEFAPPTSYYVNTSDNNSDSTSSSKKFNFKKFTNFKPTVIEPEFDAESRSTENCARNSKHKVEIPPPLSYEKSTENMKLKKTNMEELVEAGLDYLKNQTLKRNQNSRNKVIDMLES